MKNSTTACIRYLQEFENNYSQVACEPYHRNQMVELDIPFFNTSLKKPTIDTQAM